jgi:DnaJ domain
MSNSLYEILGVTPDATPDQIENAFIKQSMNTHPNTGLPYAEHLFEQVGYARNVLIDPERRAAHDKELGIVRHASPVPAPPAPSTPPASPVEIPVTQNAPTRQKSANKKKFLDGSNKMFLFMAGGAWVVMMILAALFSEEGSAGGILGMAAFISFVALVYGFTTNSLVAVATFAVMGVFLFSLGQTLLNNGFTSILLVTLLLLAVVGSFVPAYRGRSVRVREYMDRERAAQEAINSSQHVYLHHVREKK